MAVEAQACPQCGSAIHFKKGQAKIVCDYCGATVTRSAPSDVSLKKEIDDAKIVQEIKDRGKRLYRDGQPTTAKILTAQTMNIMSVTPQGKGVVMSFTVEVQPKDEAPFNASTTASIGLVAIDKYQPGTVLDVAYDPQDHTQVSVEGRHGFTDGVWQQFRKADEQIREGEKQMREGDEMLRQADEEYQQGEKEYQQGDKEYQQGDEEYQQADEKMQKLTRKRQNRR